MLSMERMAEFLSDIDLQPAWRARADIEADYYDSNQYDAKTLQDMEERGIPPIVVNLIAPTINLILGMEAKVRQDWVLKADNDSESDFAEAMSKKLQEAERATRADRACSDAYAAEVKAGLGWVHTRRQKLNPWVYPYSCEYVHRREIWWDWHSVDPRMRDARWLVRRKWYDADIVATMFPRFKTLIYQLANGWEMFEDRMLFDEAQPLYQDWLTERDFVLDFDQYSQPDRKRVGLYEVWYRVYKLGYIMETPSGAVYEFDRKNPVHVAAVKAGGKQVKIKKVPMPKMRLSFWIGPHRLADVPSPMPHEDFPYVPFWGYREDRTNIPYGHIRAMRPLQDEVNARRARMLWQLSARRLVAHEHAVKDKRAVEEELGRPDSAIWLSEKALHKNLRFEIQENTSLNTQQMQAYQDAADKLQDVANVYKEQLGKAGAADSGVAIAQLIEQGTTALAELNDNYNFARVCVGEQLFSLIKRDMEGKQEEITVTNGIGQTRKVVINEVKFDEQLGTSYRNNDVSRTNASVVLDAVPSSATFRERQFKELSNLVKGLPSPELQAAMLDMVIMASDVPYKEEIAKRIRNQLGIDPHNIEALSEEEQRAYMDRMEEQDRIKRLEEALQQLTVEHQDLENRLADAEIEKTEAETDKIKAETGKIDAEAEHTEVETESLENGDAPPGADPKKLEQQERAA